MIAKKEKRSCKCFAKECDEKFKNPCQRIIHVNAKHEGRIVCPYENCKTTMELIVFQKHVYRVHHKGDKQVPCVHCNKQILWPNITAHMKRCTSDGEKKFKCTFEGCESMFITKKGVSNHMNAVHKSPVKCPHKSCESYIKPANLVEHLKSVHENLRKTCENCGKSIIYLCLKRHLESCMSNGERKFQCTYIGCKGAFTTKRGRSSHISLIHKPPIECPWENCEFYLSPNKLKYLKKYAHRKNI